MKAGLQRQARLHRTFPGFLSVPDASHHFSRLEKVCEKTLQHGRFVIEFFRVVRGKGVSLFREPCQHSFPQEGCAVVSASCKAEGETCYTQLAGADEFDVMGWFVAADCPYLLPAPDWEIGPEDAVLLRHAGGRIQQVARP